MQDWCGDYVAIVLPTFESSAAIAGSLCSAMMGLRTGARSDRAGAVLGDCVTTDAFNSIVRIASIRMMRLSIARCPLQFVFPVL